MKRIFAAIKVKPDEHFLRVYYSLRKKLQHEKIRWVEPEKLHITLKFFGEIPEGNIEQIREQITGAVEGFTPFNINIQETGIFGSRYNPRVIWFGLTGNSVLETLGSHLLETLDKAGYLNDRQNFVPHLTIGRIKEINNKKSFQLVIDQIKDVVLQKITVDEIVLYESILKKGGPEYLVLNKIQLTK